ncbi:SDR family oxidoreductase [Bengtsoniella intestinalis]|uniref:SDR family NAD(P)-dependent oxidoreductase n=1 Tax=Bengtsoniella intestinalis TaxID=3073143 RepID=UPI00391FA2DB
MNETKYTVVVTGAASGIGKATAEHYVALGYTVVGVDVEQITATYPILMCDIGDETSVKETFTTIAQEYGSIQYLINVAGIFTAGARGTIATANLGEWSQVLATNLLGSALVTKYAIPLLRQATGDRAIVNISSDQGIHPRVNNAPYAISKSGINCLTQLIAQELLPYQIRVNAVAPASVRTNFIRDIVQSSEHMAQLYEAQEQTMPLGLIEAEDVAVLIAFLASPQSRKITGQIIMMDSGLYI